MTSKRPSLHSLLFVKLISTSVLESTLFEKRLPLLCNFQKVSLLMLILAG